MITLSRWFGQGQSPINAFFCNLETKTQKAFSLRRSLNLEKEAISTTYGVQLDHGNRVC